MLPCASAVLFASALTSNVDWYVASTKLYATRQCKPPSFPPSARSRPCRRVLPTLLKKPGVRARRDEFEIVAVHGAEHVRAPDQTPIGKIAARADFAGARDDLLQRRIAREIIRQPARRFGIRAAELDHGRRAARFVVTRVERQRIVRRDRDSERGIEPTECVSAVQRRRLIEVRRRIRRCRCCSRRVSRCCGCSAARTSGARDCSATACR